MKTPTAPLADLRRHLVTVVDAQGWTPWSVAMAAVLADETGRDEPEIRAEIDRLVDEALNPHFSHVLLFDARALTFKSECSCGDWTSRTFSSAGLAHAAWDSHVEATR